MVRIEGWTEDMGGNRKRSLSEKRYIMKRRFEALVHSLPFYICRVFPVDKKKIAMWTFECGGGYGCSPKYVAQEILKRNREGRTDYKIVWLVDDMDQEFPSGITKVRNTPWNRAYQLSTAGTWVGNSRTFYGTRKRKGQCYIQTWHATVCIKPIGMYRGSLFPKMAYLVSRYDSGLIDRVLSGSAWCDHMYRKGLIYRGKIIRTGTPRCDVLFCQGTGKRRQLRQEYHIPQEAKIMLYAPTFRGGSQKGDRSVAAEEAGVDLARLLAALEQRFGGTWYIFLRLHPQLAARFQKPKVRQVSQRLVDVTRRPDMNEIIAAADAFLTDYSSAVFEAALAGQPAFLYVDDLEDYVADRGELFFDMHKLPFPAALDNDELVDHIIRFDEAAYRKKVERFMERVGMDEDGHASERVVDLIERGP